jgi:HK97 family phage prohead protease
MEIRTLFHRDNRQIETRLEGDNDKPKIVGYAARFYDAADPGTEYELWPGLVERIMPGAFDEAAKEDDVRCLFNHDPNQVLGRTKSGTCRLSIDAVGLRYEDDPPDTECGRTVVANLKRRDVTGSSFAFSVVEERWIRREDGPDVRELVKLRLWDVSPVTYPAYEGTTAGVRAKILSDTEARDRYEAWRKQEASHDADAVEVDARWAEIAEKATD